MRLLAAIGAILIVVTVAAGGQIQPAPHGRAAISGRVVDQFGDPVVRAHVVVEVRTGPSATRAVAAGEADDRGEYRIGRLPAGSYVVAVLSIDAYLITPEATFAIPAARAPKKTYYLGAQDPSEADTLRLEADETRDRIDFVLPAALPALPPMVVARRQQAEAARAAPRLAAGSAILRGRVTATDGRAVPHAHLRLVPGGDILQTRVAVADAEGRFEFRDVGAGTVRVFASKTGYDPLEVERSVEIADYETRDGLDLTLARWNAISGQVSGDRNEPIAGATVQTLQLRYDGGRRRLVPVGAARVTNDLGRYRSYGLRPGQYVVTAALPGTAAAEMAGYTRSYYPGTANPAGAQFVSIGVAQEVDGIDIALARARTARISGKVLNSDGQPTSPGSLSLVSSVRSASAVSISIGARLAGDGSFEFSNVPPGQYVIRADRGRRQPWGEGEFGTLAVATDGADVTNLIVQTSAGSAITGRLTFNARDRSKLPAPSAFELRPLPVDFDAVPSSVATANIHDDSTFEMMGVNGPRRLELTRVAPGWALQDIRVSGIDVTDRPLPFGRREQSLNGVEVTVTDRITELTGTIVTANARGGQTAAAIVFATDRSRWYPESRFMRKTTAGSEGAFSVTGLPFGSYYVAAVASLPFSGTDDWQDPAFLETLVFRASTVTLAEGRKETIKLELPNR
jgi:hypothetical protein